MRTLVCASLAVGAVLLTVPAWAEDPASSGSAITQQDTGQSPDTMAPGEMPLQEPGTIQEPVERPETIQPVEPAPVEPAPAETSPYMAPPPTEQPQSAAGGHGVGFSVAAGGGIFNYSDKTTRGVTDLGGSYTARLGIGTRLPLSVEVAYIGTTQSVDALGLDTNANLISNGIEGELKLNLVPNGTLRPYLHGGAGWKRYDIVNEDFNTSAVNDEVDVATFPLGVGVAWVYRGFILDARGDYRFEANDRLVSGQTGPGLDNWGVTLKAGVEF